VFCNPPYKDLKRWARKCYEESLQGAVVVMLVPARTDTMWFHDWIYHKAELRFIKGRLKYNDGKQGAPFPSMIVIFRTSQGVQV
jgi:site-specific DNA-methyltransferase (adenine-specific)